MFWRAVGRIILVPLGFILAAVAAMFVLFTLGLERITQSIHGRGPDPDNWVAMFDLAQQTVMLFSTFTIVPAILLVIVGEVARIRSSIYYILGGGAVLAAWPFISKMGAIAEQPSQLGVIWTVFATAGFVGGFVYWLIAGRRA